MTRNFQKKIILKIEGMYLLTTEEKKQLIDKVSSITDISKLYLVLDKIEELEKEMHLIATELIDRMDKKELIDFKRKIEQYIIKDLEYREKIEKEKELKEIEKELEELLDEIQI